MLLARNLRTYARQCWHIHNQCCDNPDDLYSLSARMRTALSKRILRVQASTGFLDSIQEKLKAAFGGDEDWADRIEQIFNTLIWVAGRLPRVNDWRDVLAILDYITRIHFGKIAVKFLLDMVFEGGDLEAQSMDWSVMKSLISGYEAVKTHPAVVKFMKVIALAFSGGVLASLGIEEKFSEMWAMVTDCFQKILGHTDFISAVLDLFTFIGERIAAFIVTGDWRNLIHTPSNYANWSDNAFLCIEQSVGLSNPAAIGLDYHEYIERLSRTIREGEDIRKFVKSADDKDTISQLLSRLRSLYNDIMIKTACTGVREAPFPLLVHSGTGCAKSSFTDMCFAHFAKLCNKPPGKEYIYTRTAKERQWNNFKSHQWGCLLDDISSVRPGTGQEDPSLSDFLQIHNNVKFSPEQAALEDKGRTPFMCDIAIATTNTKNLNAHCWFSNPQAIRRRCPIVVELFPKEEYQDVGKQCFDKTKIPINLPGTYPDLWKIRVEKIVVSEGQRVETELMFETDNVYEFIANYNQWIDDHQASQAAFMASSKIVEEVKLCTLCRIPEAVCPCDDTRQLQLQVLETQVNVTTANATLGVATAAAAYASYKATGFATRCAGEVLNADPTIINRPGHLVAATANRILRKGKNYATNLPKRLINFTVSGIKRILINALYDYLAGFKPLLKKIWIGLGVLGGLGLTWKFLKREMPELAELEPQVRLDEAGVMPPPRNEPENVWRKDDYPPSELIGRLSASWRDMDLGHGTTIVAKNTVWCRTTHDGNKHLEFRAMCVAGHLYVVPHHVLPVTEYFDMQVIHEDNSPGCNGNVSFKMSQNLIYRRPDCELAFFEINFMPARRNLALLFPKKGVAFDAPGRMAIRNASGSITQTQSYRTHLELDKLVEQFNTRLDIASSHVERDTSNGECGCPMVVKMPCGIIVAGIHVMGGLHNLALAVPVYKEVIDEAISHFQTPIVEVVTPKLQPQSFSPVISPRCTARFVDEGTAQVFGSFSEFKRQPKSTAKDTLFTKHLLDRGITRKFAPAPMKGYAAIHLAFKSMSSKTNLFKIDVLQKCTNSFAHSILQELPKDQLRELKNPLPLRVAINGHPGTKFVDSVNFATSAGYPHNKPKRNFITRIPADDIWQHPVVLTPDFKAEVEDIWDNMMMGISSAPIFAQHIKDEALPLAKVAAGKARIHMGGPFAWGLCVRMLLLPFVRIMQMNKYIFEAAPGTNTTSIEWTRLYSYLIRHGKHRMIAGDFKDFDKMMGCFVILEAFRLIIKILKAAKADDIFLRAIQIVAEDTAFAYITFNGDLMRFFGSNPSGHPLTVIINCLVNSIYMRYCYHELNPKKEVVSFRDNVALITYGDDNDMGSGVDWFNHTSISQVLASVGITYTMPDKTAESVPFVSIDQTSFLKRRFVWSENLDAFIAPLEEDSIWKSLMICVPSKTETMEKQCIDIVKSAVCEWFFYGREKFEEQSLFLREIVCAAGLNLYVEESTFPSWETLRQRFIDNSNVYLDNEPESTKNLLGPSYWRYWKKGAFYITSDI